MFKALAKPTDVETVGKYAIRFEWNDGHEHGIYSWEYLREWCPCAECKMKREALAVASGEDSGRRRGQAEAEIAIARDISVRPPFPCGEGMGHPHFYPVRYNVDRPLALKEIPLQFLEKLNPQQREAVETVHGPVLILAGAGSGKTRVITYRIAYLVEQVGVAPDSILAMTFTNKAAAEMGERVAHLIGARTLAKPVISTFHSFCVRLLRRDIEALQVNGKGYRKDFAIYDESDQQAAGEVGDEAAGDRR